MLPFNALFVLCCHTWFVWEEGRVEGDKDKDTDSLHEHAMNEEPVKEKEKEARLTEGI